MVAWLLGVAMLALNLGPVTDPGVSLQWVPPPTAGVRLPAMAETATDRVLVRKPWCDFGRHAQRFSKGFTGVDLVFRKPSVPARNALNAIRDSIMNPQSWSSPGLAEKEFARLAATSDGPALIRLTLVDTDARIQLLGLTASLPVVAKHPRLAAFATAYLGAPDAKLAQAAVEMHFATGCDTAALYALDGFRHGDERVQLTTLRLIYEASRNHENLRLIDRIGEFISQGKGSPRARVVALRVIGQLGTESVSNYVEKLLTDKQDAVAAEGWSRWPFCSRARSKNVCRSGSATSPRSSAQRQSALLPKCTRIGATWQRSICVRCRTTRRPCPTSLAFAWRPISRSGRSPARRCATSSCDFRARVAKKPTATSQLRNAAAR